MLRKKRKKVKQRSVFSTTLCTQRIKNINLLLNAYKEIKVLCAPSVKKGIMVRNLEYSAVKRSVYNT